MWSVIFTTKLKHRFLIICLLTAWTVDPIIWSRNEAKKNILYTDIGKEICGMSLLRKRLNYVILGLQQKLGDL